MSSVVAHLDLVFVGRVQLTAGSASRSRTLGRSLLAFLGTKASCQQEMALRGSMLESREGDLIPVPQRGCVLELFSPIAVGRK